MIKKILSMLVIVGMVFFVQCTDDPITPVQEATMKAGGPGGGGGGGGGHVEVTPNNLSFPAILLSIARHLRLDPTSLPVICSKKFPCLK